MIYQTHPNHGKHIAYHTLEAENNIKNGWATVSEDEFYGVKTVSVFRPTEIVNESNNLSRDDLVEKYKDKFGKKPHHKKSDEKLMEEINGG